MGKVEGEEWAGAVGSVIGIIGGAIFAYFMVKWCVTIDPTHVYGWFKGAIHGGAWFMNWIHSWFDPAIYVKAPLHTGAYNFWFWMGAVLCSYMLFILIFSFIVNLRKVFQLKID